MRPFVVLPFCLALAFGQAEPPSPDVYLMDAASGTSRNPDSRSLPMLMTPEGSWMLMLMGQAFVVDTQQSAPRGADKLYSTNWFMTSAEHALFGGTVMLESMLSLEPATVTGERYPELFQTGETAYGRPIVDGQHPHNLVMGLGAHYAHRIGESALLHFYYAPVGDPALGPVAYPHRASAQEIPEAPLSHHWQDSTHISYNVVTTELRYKIVSLEVSGFYGTEPGENRWTIDWGPMNSYSARFSIFPSKNWAAQVSAGRLTDPERDQPGDIIRSTASLSYSRPRASSSTHPVGAWASSLIWGRNHETLTGRNLNSYLAESVYPITRRNFLTGRIEWVDKDELFDDQPALEAQLDRAVGSTFRVQAYTAGYTRDIAQFRDAETGLGFNVSAYSIPAAIQPYYGAHPWGVNVFLRVRLRR
jgi:hypothetical protein